MHPGEKPEQLPETACRSSDILVRVGMVPLSLYMRLFRKGILAQLKNQKPVPDATVPAENFARVCGYMHAVCRDNGSRFYAVLQPVNGIGSRNLTEADRTLTRMAGESMVSSSQSRLGFFTAYYHAIRRRMAGCPWFIDYSEVFSDKDGQVFFDNVHFSDRGQKIVAERLCRLIREGEKK